MMRFAVLALLIGCGNGSKSAADQQKPPTTPDEKIVVPGPEGATTGAPADGTGNAVGKGGGSGMSTAAMARAQNPAFHLKPEEGTLTIAKVEGKAGSLATAEIKLAPGTGYKIATNFPIKLQLEETSGVKVEKSLMTAGGPSEKQGDAQTLSEKALAFAVKATPQTAGAYEIKGVFSFGICEKESCHPRMQPVTITVAAN